MGSTPETVNQTVTTVDGIMNYAAFKIAFPLIVKGIKAVPYLAWLNWPIISQLFDFGMSKLMDALYIPTANYTNIVIIKMQTDAERKSYSDSESALRTSMLTGDKNAITKASADFDRTLANLVHWDGSASP